MALKRSFEHDRDTGNNNSSFESRTPSPGAKRQRRCFPMTIIPSPATAPTTTNMSGESTLAEMAVASTGGNQSVFPDVHPLITADALLARIKEEVRRLHRRHQLKSSSSQSPITTAGVPPRSPSSDLSDDDVVQAPTADSTSLTNLPGQQERRSSSIHQQQQQHLLSLKQVNVICARLLKEHEEKLREEYDRILSNKLNEQYEGFVRFTQDQLTRRFSELQFSYVS
jgi:hypothetical protein